MRCIQLFDDEISISMVIGWLDNWNTFSIGEIEDDGMYGVDRIGNSGGNSGQKSDDGISMGQLNVIMMTEAIKKLVGANVRRAIQRWIQGKTSDMEDRLTGVKQIYNRVNGNIDNNGGGTERGGEETSCGKRFAVG